MANRGFNVTSEQVDKLKLDYHRAGYSACGQISAWLGTLAKISENDLGILSVVGPSGLSIGAANGAQNRIWPDAPSLYLAALAAIVRQGKYHVSIGVPPFARDLPLFIASTLILRRVFSISAHPDSRHQGVVLIISPDISIRSRYCQLHVGKERLESAFPGSRMRFDGQVQPLSSNMVIGSVSGVCFFLPQRHILPNRVSIKPDLIILDVRYGKLTGKTEAILQWVRSKWPDAGTVALYSCGDRQNGIALRKASYVDFPLDHAGIKSAIASCSRKAEKPNEDVDLSLMQASSALIRDHQISLPVMTSSLEETIRSIADLLNSHPEDNSEINRIRWLFATYTQMPTPLVWHENAARDCGRWVPKSVIQRIGTTAHDVGGLGPVLQSIRLFFTQLNSHYDACNPKAIALRESVLQVSGGLSEDRRLIILVRDEVMQRALSSWLSLSEFFGKEWLQYVDVVACKHYLAYAHHSYQSFITAGSVHFRYRWILGGYLGTSLKFIAYPYEIALIRDQIAQFYDKRLIDRRAHRRFEAIKAISALSSVAQSNDALLYPELKLSSPIVGPSTRKLGATPPMKTTSIADLMKIVQQQSQEKDNEMDEIAPSLEKRFESVDEDSTIDETELVSASDAMDADGTACRRLQVISQERGRGVIWYANHTSVEFLRPSRSNDLFRLTPDALAVGDFILLLDQRQHQSIFDRMIEIADGNPRMKYIATYRNIWRRAINLLSAQFRDANGRVDFSRLHERLQSFGVEVTTTQTIQNWANDVVIGPASVVSIEAVGHLAGIAEMHKRAAEFDKAFSRIRSMHREIGRRVAGIVRSSFRNVVFADTVAVEQSDDDFNIPLEEIIQSIDVCEVVGIGVATETVNPDLVGMFLTDR